MFLFVVDRPEQLFWRELIVVVVDAGKVLFGSVLESCSEEKSVLVGDLWDICDRLTRSPEV